MRVIRSFRLGIDDNMNPDHIGKIIAVDHHARPNSGSPNDVLTTHYGRLVGFAEHRGTATYESVQEARQTESTDYPDWHTTLIFEDGREVRIQEWEAANITIYEEQS